MASSLEILLLTQVQFWANKPRFIGSIVAGTALGTATNIAFPVVEDPYSGWNAGSFFWVVPYSGLYRVSVQFKWNGTPPGSLPAINVKKNGANTLVSANASSTSAFTGVQMTGPVRAVAGDQIAVQLANSGFTTQVDTGANNFLFIVLESQ